MSHRRRLTTSLKRSVASKLRKDSDKLEDPEFNSAHDLVLRTLEHTGTLIKGVQDWKSKITLLSSSTISMAQMSVGLYEGKKDMLQSHNAYLQQSRSMQDVGMIEELCESNQVELENVKQQLLVLVSSVAERNALKSDYEHYAKKLKSLMKKVQQSSGKLSVEKKAKQDLKLERNMGKHKAAEMEFIQFNEFLLQRMREVTEIVRGSLDTVFTQQCIIMEMYFMKMKEPFSHISRTEDPDLSPTMKRVRSESLQTHPQSSSSFSSSSSIPVIVEEGEDVTASIQPVGETQLTMTTPVFGAETKTEQNDKYGWEASFDKFQRKVVKLISANEHSNMGSVCLLVTNQTTVKQLISMAQQKLRQSWLAQAGLDGFALHKGDRVLLDDSYVLNVFTTAELNAAALVLTIVPFEYASSSEEDEEEVFEHQDEEAKQLPDKTTAAVAVTAVAVAVKKQPKIPIPAIKPKSLQRSGSSAARPKRPPPKVPLKQKNPKHPTHTPLMEKIHIRHDPHAKLPMRVYDKREANVSFITVQISDTTTAQELRQIVRKHYQKLGKIAEQFVLVHRHKTMHGAQIVLNEYRPEERKSAILHIHMRKDDSYQYAVTQHKRKAHSRPKKIYFDGDSDDQTSSDEDNE